MDRAEQAVQNKHSGMNCAQAVLTAFADRLSLPEESLRALGAGFGIGMGTFGATCGALCAAQMVCGLTAERFGPAQARELYQQFAAQCGSTLCGELKGIGTGKVLCPCDDCVRCAVRIAAAHTDSGIRGVAD